MHKKYKKGIYKHEKNSAQKLRKAYRPYGY